HLAPVPAAPVVLDGRVRTVEVPIKKGKALRALVEVILEAAADGADLRLMQELIGLQVYGPVAGAPGESDVGLLRQHHATSAPGHVPDGPERLDLRVADPGHEVPGAYVAVADAHDQLVDELVVGVGDSDDGTWDQIGRAHV